MNPLLELLVAAKNTLILLRSCPGKIPWASKVTETNMSKNYIRLIKRIAKNVDIRGAQNLNSGQGPKS